MEQELAARSGENRHGFRHGFRCFEPALAGMSYACKVVGLYLKKNRIGREGFFRRMQFNTICAVLRRLSNTHLLDCSRG